MADKRFPNKTPLYKKLAFKTIRQWTSGWRKLPDFIVIGTQKGGTSSLYRYLETHPDLKLSYRKQLHFFDKFYFKGINWYRACFPISALNRSTITGEATPYYIIHPHAPKRMHQALPNVKLLLVVRNPIDRAYSHYQMKVDQGFEKIGSFEEAIAQEEARTGPELQKMLDDPTYYSRDYRNFSYLARGRYAEQLKRWLEFYPKDQIMVINSEHFFADPMKTLRRVYDFLGISDYKPQNLKVYNQRSYSNMEPATRKKLEAYFKPFNKEFYDLIGETYDWDDPA
jgi:hypothetical protein